MRTEIDIRRHLRAIAVSTSIATLATLLVINSHQGAEGAPPNDPQLFSGKAPGSEVIDHVDLYAVPVSRGPESPGDTASLQAVSAELVQDQRNYSVYADPVDVAPEFVSADGVVDFHLFATDTSGQTWSVNFSARGVHSSAPLAQRTSHGRMAWLDAGRSSRLIAHSLHVADSYPVLRHSADRMLSRSVGDGDPDDETVDVPIAGYEPVPLPRSAAGDPTNCLQETYVGDKNVSTTIGTSYPTGESRSWMTHTASSDSESTLGIAVGLEKDGGAVSFKANGTRFTTGSWSGTWQPAVFMRSYRIDVNYHHYVLGYGCHGAVDYWRPHVETGGASTNRNGLTRPNWNTLCGNQPKNYTFVRNNGSGKAYSYGAAVKFKSLIGVDLGIKRQYMSNQSVSYTFTNEPIHKLCGSDDYPALAGKIVDRFK